MARELWRKTGKIMFFGHFSVCLFVRPLGRGHASRVLHEPAMLKAHVTHHVEWITKKRGSLGIFRPGGLYQRSWELIGINRDF